MAAKLQTVRKACIATALLALAFAAAPSAAALCVGPGTPPWGWENSGTCGYEQAPPFYGVQDTVVCVSETNCV